MPLSQSERDLLLARVQQKLTTRRVNCSAVEAIVDQVAALLDLPDETALTASSLLAFSAESMPDLASRVRRQLAQAGVTPLESGVATVGRHTVLTMRVPSAALAQAESAASALGVRFAVVMDDSVGHAA